MKKIWHMIMAALPIAVVCSSSTAESTPIKKPIADKRDLLRDCTENNISIKDYKGEISDYTLETTGIDIILVRKGALSSECSESLTFFPGTNNEKWEARFSSGCDYKSPEKLTRLKIIMDNCPVAREILSESEAIMYQSLERGIQFPNIMRHMNASNKWPKDINNYINKNRGENPGDTMDIYGELLREELFYSDMLVKFEEVFKSMGCEISPKTGRNFAEIIWGGENEPPNQRLPSNYSKDELVKMGIFSPSEASKKYYPVIEWLNFNLDCERVEAKP